MTTPPQPHLKIGEVAQRSGLPVKTIRYYADLALLSPTMGRSPNGYRVFSPEIFQRLAFIKRAQSLGLTLEEIRTILGVHDQGSLPCGVIKQLLEEKLDQLNHQITELEILKGELQGILSGWQDFALSSNTAPSTICPNLQ